MSPLLNMPASGATTKFAILASIASHIHENINVSEMQERQKQHKSNDAVVGCSSTKDKTISDFSVKVTRVSETSIADAERKKHQCSQCSKVYQTTSNLRRHIRNTHSAPQLNKCPVCTKPLKTKEYINEHMFMKHKNRDSGKGFKCDQCDREFLFLRTLNRHTRTVHTTEPRKICHDCGKTFKHNYSLDKHKKSMHNGLKEKKHTCNQCNQAFSYAGNLKRHVETMHTITPRETCPDCGKTYKNHYGLKKHRRYKHKLNDQQKAI